MPGLDASVLKSLDPTLALGRINTDIQTDFIVAPHYSAIYAHVGEELWDEVMRSLRSGTYEPVLPITIDIPKKTGLTRPGSILNPFDRVVYQALIDSIAPTAESQLDRSRVFSNVLLNTDPEFQMFEATSVSYPRFKNNIQKYCKDKKWTHAIRTDIANFFERLYQHNLINLLYSAGCSPPAVSLLERVLLAWMEKDSHGILQGMFPSDFLGNFYLCSVDSYFVDKGLLCARFVDDFYLFYPSLYSARVGLVDLCRTLRNEGLHLNESKSGIFQTSSLLREETELDLLFADAREEVQGSMPMTETYGFQTFWKSEDEEATEDDVELQAVLTLYGRIQSSTETQADKIERFCLPILAATGSDIAIDRCLDGLSERPHLTQSYCSYLVTLIPSNPDIAKNLESLLKRDYLFHDWQLMWLLAALIKAPSVLPTMVSAAFRLLRDPRRSVALRAVCAMLIGKHGAPGQRRNLRNHYSEEPSPYVREAILFSARYFPTPERKTCLSGWRGHSSINLLIAKAVAVLC